MNESKANQRQIGGTHYKTSYEHWDFVRDAGLRYLDGCATKYLARWRKKDGRKDLEKALHYVDKMREEVYAPTSAPYFQQHTARCAERFADVNELTLEERACLLLICEKTEQSLTQANILIRLLLDDSATADGVTREDTTGQDHPFGYQAEKEAP